MRLRTYIGGILIKFLAIMLIVVGFLVSLYSGYLSQQTGEPMELYSLASWIMFLAGLIVFATSALIQRSALRRSRIGK